MANTCSATRRDGQACRTPVVSGSQWCFGHHPDLAEQRTQARRRGGQNRSNRARLTRIMPLRLVPIWEQLEGALADVLADRLAPQQATAAAALARALVAVLQAGEVEERLRTLEAAAPQTAGAGRWHA